MMPSADISDRDRIGPAPGLYPLERLGADLRGPVLIVSTKVGRGMYTMGEAVVQRLRSTTTVEHIAVEDYLPGNAVSEDLRRYKLISSRFPVLLNLPYRAPFFYARKLRREHRGVGSDLRRLRECIATIAPQTVLCVSHRPAFWVATLKRRERLRFALWGLLGEYGYTLGWRYLDWPEMNGFLSPVPRATLRYPYPARLRFEQIELPAGVGYAPLATQVADCRSVLLVCGFWGQGPILSVIRQLLAIDADMRITAVCGENASARAAAREAFARQPNVRVHGVVDSLLPFMAECRSVITKPGISTLLEARDAHRQIFLLRGMPVAEDHNAQYALRHFGAQWFTPRVFGEWLMRQA